MNSQGSSYTTTDLESAWFAVIPSFYVGGCASGHPDQRQRKAPGELVLFLRLINDLNGSPRIP